MLRCPAPSDPAPSAEGTAATPPRSGVEPSVTASSPPLAAGLPSGAPSSAKVPRTGASEGSLAKKEAEAGAGGDTGGGEQGERGVLPTAAAWGTPSAPASASARRTSNGTRGREVRAGVGDHASASPSASPLSPPSPPPPPPPSSAPPSAAPSSSPPGLVGVARCRNAEKRESHKNDQPS